MAMLSVVRDPHVTDAQAIVASLRDPHAFEAIFERHFPPIHRFLRARVGAQLAEELASETFVQAFGSRGRYDPVHPDARPWLFAIASNLVRSQRHELDDVIRTLRDDAPDEDARHAARNALRAQMRVAQKTSLRRRPVRRLAAAAGLAAAAVLAIALWPAGGSDDGAGLAPASAEAALERAARAAQSGAERALSLGEYFYVRERSAYLTTNTGEGAGWSALVPSERETWTRRDGSGRFVARDSGPPAFPGPRDRANWKAQGSPSLNRSVGPGAGMRFPPSPITAGGSSLTYAQLSELPSDGEAMYRRLIELANGAGPSPDVEAFVIIGDLLRSVPVPPHVRAGLYRAAAHIKGVRYAGAVTDELGRRGLAIELTEDHGRRRLVFDPETSQVLVEQEVLTARVPGLDADPGFVRGYRLVLEQGIVASDTERP